MSERSQKFNKSENIFFPSENSVSQEEIDNLKQNLTETDLSHFFKINIFKILKAKDNKEKKSRITIRDYIKEHEEINKVKYNIFMIIFNDCKYNEEYSATINQNENYFNLKRLVIQNCHIKENILILDKKQYSFIPYRRGTQDILFPYNNGTIKILIEKKMNLMINGKAIEGLTEKEFISKTNIIMPEIERKIKERVIKSKSDKKSTKKKNLSDIKSEKSYNFLHQIEQNNIVNNESNYKKEKHLLIKNFPKPLGNYHNIIEDEKLNYTKEENTNNEKISKKEKDKINDLKNDLADYIDKKNMINKNKNNKCEKEDKIVNLSNKNPYSAPLKDIISSNETENSNDSMKEVLGDTIYIKKDENTYTRYIYTNQYAKEVDGIYTKHKEINLNINKEIALNDLQKGIDYKNDNDLKIHIIYKNFVGEKIKEDIPFILEIKKNFRLVEILEQIALDSKILDNIKIKTDNINLPRFIIGVLCNYSKIGIKKEMEQLNQIYINNPNETKLQHIINVIKDCKINVIVGFIQNQKINDYRLDIEDYNIKDSDNNSAMRVDIKYMYRKICNEELDVQKFNDIIAKNKNKYKSLTFEKKIGYIQHQKKIMEINEQYEKEKEKLQEENKKLQKMLEDEKKKREELEEKIKKLTGETENNKIE